MEIEPSYIYDAKNGGRVPVFKPSMEQFGDFYKFVTAISKYGKQAGIVKIIPPKEWSDSLPDLADKLKSKKIRHPIEQVFNGSKGIYRQDNIEKNRCYSLKQWRALCESPNHRPPTRNYTQAKQLPNTRNSTRAKQPPTPPPGVSKKRKSEAQLQSEKAKAEKVQKQESAEFGSRNLDDYEVDIDKLTNSNHNNNDEVEGGFDYRIYNQAQYTNEYCKEIERDYWRTLPFNNSLYGADMIGSLFDTEITKTWNIDRLDNLLNRINVNIPGVNRAYLYFGMWKATFAWHVEDMDLYSINYIHFGAPKQWYAIPPPYSRKFETVMRGYFSHEYQNCREYLRHKQFIVKPSILAESNIPVNYLVQHEGEFVITFPYGYHAGYNLDYNCAESVNFALDDWIPIGKKAGACRCQNDSVKIDVASFFDERIPDAIVPASKTRLILLPTPPREKKMLRSRKETVVDGDVDQEETDTGYELEQQSPGTPITPTHHYLVYSKDDDSSSSIDLEDEGYMEEDKKYKDIVADDGDEDEMVVVHKPKLRIIHKNQKIQCMLCPVEGGQLFRTEEDGYAHLLCASFVPETDIAQIMGTERVIGINRIPKARWNLASFCFVWIEKLQWKTIECVRPFHPSCAEQAEYHLQQRLTACGELLYEGFCKLHDPRILLEKKKKMAELSSMVAIDRDVWAKAYGSFYKGKIIEKDEETQKCKILFMDGSSSATAIYQRRATSSAGLKMNNLLSPISTKAPSGVFSVVSHTVKPQRLNDTNKELPIPTNKFYENFLLEDGRQPTWPLPYGVRWENGQTAGVLGLSISHADDSSKVYGPNPNANPVTYFYNPYTPSLSISAAEFGQTHSLTVSDLDEFSVKLQLSPTNATASYISIPIVRGMGFITAQYKQLTPVFNSAVKFRKIELANDAKKGWVKYRIQLEDDNNWLLYAKSHDKSPALKLNVKNATIVEAVSGVFTGLIQIAKVPRDNTAAEKLYDQNAGTFATNGKLSVTNDGDSFTDATKKVNIQLQSPTTGLMTAYVGDNWILEEKHLNKISFLPAGWKSQLTKEQKDVIAKQAKIDVASDFKAQTLDKNSVYFSGKGIAKLALVCLVAHDVLKDKSLGTECLNKLKTVMESYTKNRLTFPLQYDSTWKGIVSSEGFKNGSMADFGNTWYNDHHFHYGYYIHAAAIIRHLDEDWGKKNEEWVDSLLRDVVNPSSKDKFFPTFRTFDWFVGHSWSKGIFASVDGKDEESTSEDTNLYYAMKLWGTVSHRKNLEKLADVILAVQARSLRTYFLMEDDNTVQPKNFIKNKVTGILFENKIDHTTYFCTRMECIHGIHMIPTTPITPYTRRNKFVTEEWEEVLSSIVDNITDAWKSLLQMNYAQINSKSVYNYFLQHPDAPLDDGLTRTWALFWSASQKPTN
ncbi:8510_t:CDS:10 [Ambispora gerdemannii]|uniref:glucan endo-1,3-beta-D-glucosidase n=1 Tax=Ambispora gerdemannii TaxID=144530 RepID=A0A9N8W2F3_9GLOM|nr:8510_t:CDS:10 [Ambispora gerdemannii]